VPSTQYEQLGLASWYSSRPGYCASPYLSFGTVLTITDLATGVSIRCTVDDRQAINPGRVVDLSYTGFEDLARPSIGLIKVRLTW
jgi:rare lipoprotein A (peptidoglycan hydrolase)